MNVGDSHLQRQQIRRFQNSFWKDFRQLPDPMTDSVVHHAAQEVLLQVLVERINRHDAVGGDVFLVGRFPFRVAHHRTTEEDVDLSGKDDPHANMDLMDQPGTVEPRYAHKAGPI